MLVRGIRGATCVKSDSKEEIIAATAELLEEIVKQNQLAVADIASVIFSVTRDISAEFPAAAAHQMGWKDTPLLCTYEIDVPGSLSRCIRILMLVNTEKKPGEIKHVYLREAVVLRRQ